SSVAKGRSRERPQGPAQRAGNLQATSVIKPIPEHARMAKLVDDEQDARVSRKAGAESDRKDQHNVLATFRQHQ
ncbi:hypothetical protein, partial [Porticoccus sp.]|uniref:hypothetical protein n=1 Tax=Porticoccus sp. TaxID=2024853 RepID=UPI0039E5E5F0